MDNYIDNLGKPLNFILRIWPKKQIFMVFIKPTLEVGSKGRTWTHDLFG